MPTFCDFKDKIITKSLWLCFRRKSKETNIRSGTFFGVQFFLNGGHFSIQFGTVSIQVSVTSLVITITQFIPFLIGCPAILFYIGTGFEVTWGPSRNPNLFSTREKLCKVTKIGCSFSMRHFFVGGRWVSMGRSPSCLLSVSIGGCT